MFQPILGDINNVYSGVMLSNSLPYSVEQGWKLTEKEEKIQSFLKLINNKQGLEEMKAFYRKNSDILLSEGKIVDSFQEPEFRFLPFVLKVRENIFSLKLKYHELCLTNDAIYAEIAKLNKLMENLLKQTEEYNRIVLMYRITNEQSATEPPDATINEMVDKQIANIRIVLTKQEEKVKENETQMCEIMNIIQLLKQIITIPPEEIVVIPENKDQEPELATKAVCVICSSRSIEFCLAGCGHCFCGKCADNIKENCHICRRAKSAKIKLFYD